MQSVLDTPIIGDAADRAAFENRADNDVEVEKPRPRVVSPVPRELTAATRKKVGLPAAKIPAYRFAYIGLLCALIGVPMLMLGWFKAMFALVFVSLGVLPLVRWYERREIELRDRVYTHGDEVVGRVIDVEPGGPDRNGKIVRIEFLVGEQRVAASVFGCPLTRKGLEPGDDVVLYYAPSEPHRCLIVERIPRKSSVKARRRPEPSGCGGGGCGKGACGGGGCGAGACGAGGCGTGGCC